MRYTRFTARHNNVRRTKVHRPYRRMHESAELPTFTEVLDTALPVIDKAAARCGVDIDWSSEHVNFYGGPDDTTYEVRYLITGADSARSIDKLDVELMKSIGKSSNPVLRAADAVAEVDTYDTLTAGPFENGLMSEVVLGFDALEG